MKKAMQLESLRDVASQINSGADLPAMLQQLVKVSCYHNDWTMGSIMAVDMAEGYAHVVARYDPTLLNRPVSDHWELTSSPSVDALQRNQPVLIQDVRESDYEGYRRESFERDYRTVLIMPMSCRDFDNRPMVLSLVSRPLKQINEADLTFLGLVVHLGVIAVERERQLEEQRRTALRLQQALGVHTTLLQHVLAQGTVPSLSALVGNLLPSPLVAIDFTTNQVIGGRSPIAQYDDATWRQRVGGPLAAQLATHAHEALDSSVRGETLLFLDDDGRQLTLKARIEPLSVDNERVGALLLFDAPRALAELDLLLLESAKFALSVQMMRTYIRFRFETRTQAELFGEIVERRWRDAVDLEQRAQRLSISFLELQQMIIVDYPADPRRPGTAANLHHNVSRLLDRANMGCPVIPLENGLVCLLRVTAVDRSEKLSKVLRQITLELARHLGFEPLLIVSTPCATLEDYPPAWQRCRRMFEIAHSFGRTGVLSNQDFGPMPMLVAAVGGTDIRAYVDDQLGGLVEHDRQHGTHYLGTLSSFLQHGCRSQPCADAMGVHVTTLRYRLGRIEDLFSIGLHTPEQRFATELAVQLHKVMHS